MKSSKPINDDHRAGTNSAKEGIGGGNSASPLGPRKDPLTRGNQKQIMVVDDEPDIRRLFSLILENAGYTITHSASDGLSAVRTLEHDGDVDLLIIDQRMPTMDGVKASREIKQMLPTLKIIMVTAYDVPKEDLPLFHAVLLKPVSSQKLVQTVAEAFKA